MSAQPRDADGVLDGLLALSPPGWALPHDPDSAWANCLRPWASEVARIETTTAAMIEEIDPRSAVYLLADYQRVLGPDPYGRDAASNDLSEQEMALLTWQRWTASGGSAAADYVALAAQMGIAISIQQFQTMKCGAAVCGAAALINTPHQFEWLVTVPRTQVTPMICGASRCGDMLGQITPSPIVPVITGEAPAHTLPVFSYTG